ncbi:MAG: hypothetical protein V7K40_25200 [Nostoc sp.]
MSFDSARAKRPAIHVQHRLNHSYPLTARAKRPAIANSTHNYVPIYTAAENQSTE